MTSFVKSAQQLIDVDGNSEIIEIIYTKYIEGYGYEDFTDVFETSFVGKQINFLPKKTVRYEQFLDTMVNNTTETQRKCVLVQLDNVLFENKNVYSLIRIMNAVKILDPTFIPPLINVTCSWQKRMVKDFCLSTFPNIIETTTNNYRLNRLFRVLQLIEEDMRY